MTHTNKKHIKPYTQLTTLDNQTLQIEVFTGEKSNAKTLTFTSKLSLTNYIDRLRKTTCKHVNKETGEITPPEITYPLCIIDNVRNMTFKFNMTEQSQKTSVQLSHKVTRSDNLRFRPPTMVKVEKSSKDIRKERIQDIVRDIEFGDLDQAKHKLDKYFDK